jgi:hypothetical protein
MSWKLGSEWIARALTIGLVLSVSGAHAGGKTAVVDVLTNGTSMLRITIYTNPDIRYPNLRQFAVIAIAEGVRINSIAFDAADWSTMMTLWNKAVAAQSATWKGVGAFTDTSGADSSTLNLKAGSGVTFAVSSPTKGTVTYVLPRADLNRLGADLLKVKTSLANKTVE